MGAMNNKTGYSIVKSPQQLLISAVVLILFSDLVFLALILLLVAIRNGIGVDSSLVGFTTLIFLIKSALTAGALYKMLHTWLGVTYFVVNNRLYIDSDVRHVNSTVIELKDVFKASADRKYRGFNKTEYGDVIIEFRTRASDNKISLTGIKNPEEVAAKIAETS
jgi:predicted membrane protein